jgi:5-methylcytosine-specific restriction endonuclease McrA
VPTRQRQGLLKSRGYRCEDCGATGGPLEVHHRDHDPTNNAPGNHVILCAPCHKGRHTAHG